MKITRKQLIDLCIKFSKSENVKYEQTQTQFMSYSYDNHLILLKRGIEVCRISLLSPKPNSNEPYDLRLTGNIHARIKITPQDKDWKKVIRCFKQNPYNFPSYKQLLKLL